MKITFLLTAAFLMLANCAFAQSFDFESTSPGFYASSLTVVNGSQTLTVTPEGAPNGFLNVVNPGVPLLGSLSVIGSRTNPLRIGQFAPLRFTFARPVDTITFAFGDDGSDDDSPVTIQGFSAANVLLGTLTTDYPANFGSGKTLSGSFGGASYFLLTSAGGQNNDNSIFWEVTASTPVVPEPGSLALLVGVGTTGAGFLVRRRKQVCKAA